MPTFLRVLIQQIHRYRYSIFSVIEQRDSVSSMTRLVARCRHLEIRCPSQFSCRHCLATIRAQLDTRSGAFSWLYLSKSKSFGRYCHVTAQYPEPRWAVEEEDNMHTGHIAELSSLLEPPGRCVFNRRVNNMPRSTDVTRLCLGL